MAENEKSAKEKKMIQNHFLFRANTIQDIPPLPNAIKPFSVIERIS
jgi:hypothetical protein